MTKRNEIYDIVTKCLSIIFGTSADTLQEDTRLVEDLGAKSFNISQLANYLQDELEIAIPYIELHRRATVGDVVDCVLDQLDY